MRSRGLVWSLGTMLVITIVSVGTTILTGKSPLLGLDLKGGVSVVEQPQGRVNGTTLNEAQSIIDNRVNGLGVSNSNVTIQGKDIVIELPGARNDTQVLSVVGQTAQLFFRPVECIISPYIAPTPSGSTVAPKTGTTTTTVPRATTTTVAGSGGGKASPTSTTAKKSAAGLPGRPPLVSINARLASVSYPLAAGKSATTATTAAGTPSTSTSASTSASTSTSTGKGASSGAGATSTTLAPTTTTTASLAAQICNLSGTAQESYMPPHGDKNGLTPAASDDRAATVVLPYYADYVKGKYVTNERFVLGPAEMSGAIVHSATPYLDSQTDEWQVNLSFTSSGSKLFNKYATAHYQCYQEDPSNPPYCAQQAIELDATVESNPAIEASSYPGGATINGSTQDPFTDAQATDLANALTYGSLPVRFVAQDISNVSPQIGTDSLKAGAIAGAIAILLVILYLLLYYRALGLVVVVSICLSGALVYSITTLLSQTSGLALTLSGVIGLIVSVGVTADSCVVYFERLKEEIRSGRTVRTSVEKGFGRAFRTILAADFSSFIAALILYTLTVGDVRGFAFFLGLATLLNVVVTYFFTRPLVILAGRRASLGEGRFLGVSRGLGARGTKSMNVEQA